MTTTKPTSFQSGQHLMSRAINDLSMAHKEFALFLFECLTRHLKGDWGDCCPEDIATNEEALLNGDRLFSVYHLPQELNNIHTNDKLWIITEANRQYTTVIFPNDY